MKINSELKSWRIDFSLDEDKTVLFCDENSDTQTPAETYSDTVRSRNQSLKQPALTEQKLLWRQGAIKKLVPWQVFNNKTHHSLIMILFVNFIFISQISNLLENCQKHILSSVDENLINVQFPQRNHHLSLSFIQFFWLYFYIFSSPHWFCTLLNWCQWKILL